MSSIMNSGVSLTGIVDITAHSISLLHDNEIKK